MRGDGNKLHPQSSQLLNLLGDTDELEGLQLVEPIGGIKSATHTCQNGSVTGTRNKVA